MMEVSIILRTIQFGGLDDLPEERTARVVFEIQADDVGTIDLVIDVVPEDDDPNSLDGAVLIAKRTLLDFGKALVAAGENYQPPRIYSLKDQ